MSYRTRLPALVAGLFLLASTAGAFTNVIGVSVDTTWDLEGSPYLIKAAVTVPADTLLTIDAGVVVQFDVSYPLTIDGTLLVNGTNDADSAVQFIRGTSPDSAKFWQGIVVSSIGTATISYAVISDALGAGVSSAGTTRLTNCTIAKGDTGLSITGGSAFVSNTIIWDNDLGIVRTGGLYLVEYSDVQGTISPGSSKGVGVISADPNFADATARDFSLAPPSPAIDAGDTTSADDPDGSVADMGALPFDKLTLNAPVFATVDTQTVDEGATLEFTISATDLDDDIAFYEASSLPTGAAFVPGTQTFTWVPEYDQGGDTTVAVFRVVDEAGFADTLTVDIIVNDVPQPPVFVAQADTSVDEGGTLEFAVVANDVDDDIDFYEAVSLPTGATFVPGTQTFTWVPEYDQAGDTVAVFRVVDDTEFEDELIVNITVNDVSTEFTWSNDTTITGAYTVQTGDTLTIAAGVTVTFNANVALTINNGTLQVNGTSANPVEFVRGTTPWQGISVKDTGTATINYAVITGSAGSGILTGGGNVTLINCTIARNLGNGVTNDSGTTNIKGAIIWGNGTGAISGAIGGTVIVSYSDVQGVFPILATDAGNNINLDPTFVGAAAGNFSLVWGSPAIDAGGYSGSAPDPDGSVADMGALAFNKATLNVPVLTAVPAADTLAETDSLTVKFTATDANANLSSYQVVSLPSGATFTAFGIDSAKVGWRPTYAQGQVAAHQAKIRAVDLTGLADTVTVAITVTNVNRTPTWSPVDAATITEGDTLKAKLRAGDPDGDALQYSIAGITDHWIFAADTTLRWKALYTFVKAPDTVKVVNVIITASDTTAVRGVFSYDSTRFVLRDTIVVSVRNKNLLPVWLTRAPNDTVNEGVTVKFKLDVSDVDGDSLIGAVVKGPAGLVVDGGGLKDSVIWTPNKDVASVITPSVTDSVIVSVTDRIATVYDTVLITVKDVNRLPEWKPLEVIPPSVRATQTAVGELLSFKAEATDADGNVLTYRSPTVIPAGATYDTVSLVFEWTPTAAQAGPATVTLRVTDGAAPVNLTIGLLVTNMQLAAYDVPNDQGGRVLLTWNAYKGDTGVSSYSIWRALPDGAVAKPGRAARAFRLGTIDYAWEQIDTTRTHGLKRYAYTAETLYDAMAGVAGTHLFMVSADGTGGPWDSNVADVASVDNLAPAAPAKLAGEGAHGKITLHWAPNTELDISQYVIYRGIMPGMMLALATTTDTLFVDATLPQVRLLYYAVMAQDIHKNLSERSQVTVPGPTGIVPVVPTAYALEQNIPNPFNPATTIRFSLPEAGQVRLVIYNVSGQVVRTLLNQEMPVGFHAVTWDGTDSYGRQLSSGVYLYRVTSEKGTIVRRMLLVR